MKSKAKKLISLCAASLALSAVLSVGIAAVPVTPSYQKLLYETDTFALMRASTPYYTEVGVITDGNGNEKNCRGLQMRDIEGGYVSANGWVTGLAGTHVEVYIDGMATTGNISPANNRKCNTESDCATVFSCKGTLIRAKSHFKINYACSSNSDHKVKSGYNHWDDVISFEV